jgi:alpha-beta hydrolase superfamily lysophospholipase
MKIVKAKTKDGIHFTGFLSEPVKEKKGIIVHIHGMAGSPYDNSWYPYFHELFPKSGYAFLVGQHRGTGSITQFFKEPNQYPNYGDAFELFEDSAEDIDTWVNFARSLGYSNTILQGHSFAPSKITYYVNQRASVDIEALIYISPVDMLGMTTVNNDHDHKSMLQEAREFVKDGNPRQLLSQLLDGEYYISAQTYANLFEDDAYANVFCYTNRKHDWSFVNKIKLPILLIGGTKDFPIESVSSSNDAFKILKQELKNSLQVSSKIYQGATHSFEGYERQIVTDVVDFVES